MTGPAVATMETLDWDELVANHWDRAPVLIKNCPTPPFELAEVFRAAVGGVRLPAPGVMPHRAQFAVERYQQLDPAGWFPEDADGSFAGYQKRIAEQIGDRRYALTVHLFHTVDPAQWQRECAFYAGLWERVGRPVTSAITTLFHGNYEHSPVGVHLDRFATFMFALRGRKRMRFWAERPWADPVSTVLDYRPYLDSSFPVEVRPGELLYWPAGYYHVGESALSGDPATSVNVGIPRNGHRAHFDLEDFLGDFSVEPWLDRQAALDRQPPDPAGLLAPPDAAGPDRGDGLPIVLARALADLERVGADGPVRERVAVLSMQRWTSGGFHPAPPPDRPRPLAAADAVRATAPIRWAAGPERRLCAANGHVAATPLPGDALQRLLARLRSGPPVPAGALAEDACRLLETLESFRAVART